MSEIRLNVNIMEMSEGIHTITFYTLKKAVI